MSANYLHIMNIILLIKSLTNLSAMWLAGFNRGELIRCSHYFTDEGYYIIFLFLVIYIDKVLPFWKEDGFVQEILIPSCTLESWACEPWGLILDQGFADVLDSWLAFSSTKRFLSGGRKGNGKWSHFKAYWLWTSWLRQNHFWDHFVHNEQAYHVPNSVLKGN